MRLRRETGKKSIMKPKSITALAISLLALVIMLQNTQTVTIHLLFWQIVMPQILLIFLILVGGLLVGYVLGSLRGGRP